MKRILPILFLLMSLAVAMREIPELYNLADDPSNDGQVFCWQDATAVCPNHCAEHRDLAPSAAATTFAHVENLKCTSVVLASTGQDILRLVSSLRT